MHVVEWTINNFSYWNGYVHEKQIECSGSGFSNFPRILLYPRGLSGCGEQLVVHIHGKSIVTIALSGQLSCIDSNGYLFCRLQFEKNAKKGDFKELLPELKFTEVAAQLRRNQHQDQFTLRFELRSEYDRAFRMYTTIDVFDSSLEIDPTKIKEAEKRFISTITYDECENDARALWVVREKDLLYIEPKSRKKNILVSASLSVLKFGSVTRTEENEHVFQDETRWPFVSSLTRKELTEEGFSLLLRIKIATDNKYKHHYGYFTAYPKSIYLLSTTIPTLTDNRNAPISNKPGSAVTVLLNELMCLYKDHDFSDFQLRCGEVYIPTHKSILSARSPVFKAMLLSDMREAASDSLDVVDLDVHTLGCFLVFLYTGTLDGRLEWEAALKLYYAADKYQVPTLKRECFSVFLQQVSISNVCDILSLADKHQDVELSTEAQDFVLQNYNEVLRSEGWRTFLMNEPLLAAKTVTYFAENNEFKVITYS